MNFDWNDLKLFLAAAEAGSFTSAARAAKVSQPTLGRRIDALEASLGVTLFDRGPRGLTLTAGGADLLTHARAVEAAAAKASLSAAGRAQTLDGTVRITAPRLVSAHHMPAIITRLLDAEPGIEVELDASDATGDLSLRQADIAVRMFRPTQGDLIAKRVATIGMGLYASHGYIAEHGRPASLARIVEHRLVGYDADRRIVDWMAAQGAAPKRSAFRLRIDDQIAYWPMVVAGAGVGVCQRMIGDAEPKVERVLEELDLPELPVWLTTHSELRTSALIRRVYDFLADALSALR